MKTRGALPDPCATKGSARYLTFVLLTTFPLLTRPWRASVPVRVIVPERVQFVRWLRKRQRGLQFLKRINNSSS